MRAFWKFAILDDWAVLRAWQQVKSSRSWDNLAVVSDFVHWSEVPSGAVMGPWLIYALVDPTDECVRYVGYTEHRLEVRLKGHLKNPTNHRMAAWIASLAARDLKPSIRLLSSTAIDWEQMERGWIAWFRKRGKLLNIHAGGRFKTKKEPREKRPVPPKTAAWEARQREKERKKNSIYDDRGRPDRAKLAKISARQMASRRK